MANTFLPTSFTVTSTFATLASYLASAGISDAVNNPIASANGYIRNEDASISLYVGFGTSAPTSYETVAPQSALLFNAGLNANEVWLKSASSTVVAGFAEGGIYSTPKIDGVIGTITLTENYLAKADANGNLINGNLFDDGTVTVDGADFLINGGTATASGGFLSSSGGIGYTTGAGGAVTQLTNKSTSVSSDTLTTAITMNNAALNAATTVSFTFNNLLIAATDTVICTHQSAGTSGAYTINAFPGAGSAVISVRNNTAGNLSEAIVLRVTVIKSVSA